MLRREKILESPEVDSQTIKHELASFAKDLAFVSNFAQQLSIVFFAAPETEQLRQVLKDSIGFKGNTVRDERRARLFHILLYTFSHNIVATLAFCLWGGAFLTASTFLQKIDPLDVSLMFYLEIDQLIDLIERPLFRHLHLRMLECEDISCETFYYRHHEILEDRLLKFQKDWMDRRGDQVLSNSMGCLRLVGSLKR